MNDLTISAALPRTAAALPLSQALPEKQTRHHEPKVTGKVRDALNAMIWDGLPRKDAAAQAGISEHGLYKALRKPAVKALYLSELEVLRTSERARNIHTLAEVRDQKTNQMARVQAVKVLEQISDESHERGPAAPFSGVVVNIIQAAAHAPQAPIPVQVIENTEDER